ncbi:MAG: hypothetical protein J5I59_11715 [Saprospiraceae bacterium]|nr:hypothetical protein [Saprospiraceae bacterium]
MKEFNKKLGIYSIVFLLYLSNTGLIYSVHTCLHSGISVIELPSFGTEEDHCADVIKDSSCGDKSDDCCSEPTPVKKDCHTHHTEYKKADFESVKPEPNFYPSFDLAIQAEPFIISYLFSLPVVTKSFNLDQYTQKNKDGTSESALDYRIGLGSFLC